MIKIKGNEKELIVLIEDYENPHFDFKLCLPGSEQIEATYFKGKEYELRQETPSKIRMIFNPDAFKRTPLAMDCNMIGELIYDDDKKTLIQLIYSKGHREKPRLLNVTQFQGAEIKSREIMRNLLDDVLIYLQESESAFYSFTLKGRKYNAFMGAFIQNEGRPIEKRRFVKYAETCGLLTRYAITALEKEEGILLMDVDSLIQIQPESLRKRMQEKENTKPAWMVASHVIRHFRSRPLIRNTAPAMRHVTNSVHEME